ncbi:MAG: hypothetical protein IT374_05045 [Polyangiaceae bacterium]|nr:hypothetical protein [Polyangiaceae bacterium]
MSAAASAPPPPSAPVASASASARAVSPPPSCTPSGTTACLRGAQLEDAALLLSRLHERPIVILGVHPVRLTGAIGGDSAKKAFDSLVDAANDRKVLVDHFALDGAEWLAPWSITRERPSPKSTGVPGCAEKIDVSFVRAKVVRGLLRLNADLNRLTVDAPESLVEVGDMTVVGRGVDLCLLLSHAIELGGGRLRVKGKKLAVDGGHLPSRGEPDAPSCPDEGPPLTAAALPCFPIAELEVTAIGGAGERRLALVRSRHGRTAFSRSVPVRVGSHVGLEQMRVESIGDDGLHGEGARVVPLAPE